jgi:hypothetical protein
MSGSNGGCGDFAGIFCRVLNPGVASVHRDNIVLNLGVRAFGIMRRRYYWDVSGSWREAGSRDRRPAMIITF